MAEKILIVDDDIDSLKLIGLMLQRQGYEVAAANMGAHAIAKAASEHPDLIILDVMMPDMDGYEVCRRLRGNPSTKSIPIIMFTAKTLVDDKVAGFEAGADDYLTKPTHPAELASRVKANLARRAAKEGTDRSDLGKLVSVIGAKGGVGTTTIATNIAAAMHVRETVILADFRPGQGTMGLALGFCRSTGLANLLTRQASDVNPQTVRGELVNHKSGMRLLLSSIRQREALLPVSPGALANIVRSLRSLSRLVVVDLGTGISPVNQKILRESTQIVLVAEPLRTALTMARSILQDLAEMGIARDQVTIILLSRSQSNMQIAWQDAEQILENKIHSVIPPAPELALQAADAGEPIIQMQAQAVVATQFQKIAERLMTQMKVGEPTV